MALLVPDVGEVQLLKYALNFSAAENQTLKLYATNVTPAEGDTAASYTAAAGGGYADKTLTGSSWVVATATGTTTATYAAQTYTFTGALTTNAVIYGYFVVGATSGILLWAELAGATFTPASNGDTYTVTPAIQLAWDVLWFDVVSFVVPTVITFYFTWKQARNDCAMHQKLDDILRAVPEARNELMGIEKE